MTKWIHACFLVKYTSKVLQSSSLSHLQHHYVLKKLIKPLSYNNICTQYGITYHTSSSLETSKSKQKKPKNVIQFKPKSKLPVIELWKGATSINIADATNRDLDDVFDAISYLENYELYQDAEIEINDINTIAAIVKRLGFKVQFLKPPQESDETAKKKDLRKRPAPDVKDLVKRPPVVAIMGHVDHGKTTLLDALRHSSIVSQEFGGITQHIGAFTVNLPSGQITFLDTPGHAAFKTMRARGAHATDLVVLVVAVDDGIMEQTIESVRFAKEANVPIIVAINKIDKATHDVDKVKQGLLNCGLQVEELGGDIQAIPISALKKINLDLLTEAILTQAEVMGISGDPKGPVEGIVLESSLDTTKGKVSTALVQRGTLRKGSFIVAGTAWAKVRNMYDEKGLLLKEVTPGMPVQIIGWKSFPLAGEVILEANSEKHAREVIRYRETKKMEEKMLSDQSEIQKKAEAHRAKYQEERMARLLKGRYRKQKNYFREKELIEDTFPTVSFVLKGDVHGSVEAILDVVNTYQSHDSCRLEVIHSGVGNVTENDIEFAEDFDGFVYTFNVTVPPEIKRIATEKDIKIKPYNVIYHLIADLKVEINSKLPVVDEEDIIGEATVLQEFLINEGKKKVPVAGCKCIKGTLKKDSLCKVIRNDSVVYNGTIASLKHEKSNVDTIKKDVECGLMVDNKEISFLPGDTIICYSLRTVAQVTNWNPGF